MLDAFDCWDFFSFSFFSIGYLCILLHKYLIAANYWMARISWNDAVYCGFFGTLVWFSIPLNATSMKFKCIASAFESRVDNVMHICSALLIS